jgi:hypothetical protein
VDSNNGRLTVNNAIADNVLLFKDTVEADNYIDIVGFLSSVKVKLPDEKFTPSWLWKRASMRRSRLRCPSSMSLPITPQYTGIHGERFPCKRLRRRHMDIQQQD